MGSLAQAKTLGVIGSLLVLLSSFPFFMGALLSVYAHAGTVIGLIGFFLMLIAVKNISEVVADRSIFNNMVIFFILTVAGAVAGSVVARYAILASFFMVSMIFYMISVIFLKRSYDAIASKISIPMFSTVAFLKYIVAVLFGIFFFLILLSYLYSSFTKSILTETTLIGGTAYAISFLAGIIGYLPPFLEPIAYFSIPTPHEGSQEITIIDTTIKGQ